MANNRKISEDEMPVTNKKGITKMNTTRTQKIVAKTKASGKRVGVKADETKEKKAKKSSTSKVTTKSRKTTTKKTTKATSSKTTRKATSTRKKKLTENDKITSQTPLVQNFAESEYYDLPFAYNQTVVKILAQTPEILFVYWDISDEDRQKYIETYGENFFNETKPVLIITNKTMNYSFEVDINDFANSWYLHINDPKCEYNIELGRRPISKEIELPNNYMYVASSNVIEAPNDHILFEKEQSVAYFKNVKTDVVSEKPITKLTFMNRLGKIYNIYDMYKQIYKNENFDEASKIMGNSSSIFK